MNIGLPFLIGALISSAIFSHCDYPGDFNARIFAI
jgi:hypothetical protein